MAKITRGLTVQGFNKQCTWLSEENTVSKTGLCSVIPFYENIQERKIHCIWMVTYTEGYIYTYARVFLLLNYFTVYIECSFVNKKQISKLKKKSCFYVTLGGSIHSCEVVLPK